MVDNKQPTQQPAMESCEEPANEQIVQCYSELAKELKEAFPQVSARSCDTRACVLAKAVDEWIKQLEEFFDTLIKEHMNESIREFTAQKELEEKDIEVSNKIIEYSSETICRLERLAKIVPQIEKTLEAKNATMHQLEFLERVRERVDKLNLTEPLQSAEEEATSVMALLEKIN